MNATVNQHFSRSSLLGVTVVFLALFADPRSAWGWCRSTTGNVLRSADSCPEGGVPLLWRTRCRAVSVGIAPLPAELSLDEFRLEVDRAGQRWASVSCGGMAASAAFIPWPDCTSAQYWSASGGNANTVAFRTTWNDDAAHRAGALAVTLVTFDAEDGTILDADIDINLRTETNPGGFLYSVTGAPGRADLPTILTHELGHALGLAHSADRNAVLWPAVGNGTTRREPSTDDQAGLCTAHPPGEVRPCNLEPSGGFACREGCRCAHLPTRSAPPQVLWLLGAFAIALRCARVRRQP